MFQVSSLNKVSRVFPLLPHKVKKKFTKNIQTLMTHISEENIGLRDKRNKNLKKKNKTVKTRTK